MTGLREVESNVKVEGVAIKEKEESVVAVDLAKLR